MYATYSDMHALVFVLTPTFSGRMVMKSKTLVCRDEILLTLAFTRQNVSFEITRITSNEGMTVPLWLQHCWVLCRLTSLQPKKMYVM